MSRMSRILNILSLVAIVIAVVITIVIFKVSLTDVSVSWFIVPSVLGVSFYLKKKMNEKNIEIYGIGAVVGIVIGVVLYMLSNTYLFSEGTYIEAAKPSSEKIELHPDAKHTRVITKKMALVLAKQSISKKVDGVNISTQFSLNASAGSLQLVDGKLTWVFPLDYQGFVKYLNQDYVPGYVKVPATDGEGKAVLVSNKKIKVTENAWFGDSISLIGWKESNFGVYSYHFEIDEEGTPYWIVVAKKSLNLGGRVRVVDFVTVINAETKEKVKGSVEEITEQFPWIDKIVDEDQAENILDGYLMLKNGWFNQLPILGPKENIAKPTSYNGRELWLVQINGRTYYISGLSSITSNDSSLIGVVFQDSITGETFINDNITGMDESAAVKAIEGALGNDAVKWNVVLPQLVEYNGKWYWSATIISGSGFFQKVGVVQIDNSKNVFFGKSVQLALESSSYFEDGYKGQSTEMVTVPKNELIKLQKQLREMQQTLNVLLSK